MTARLRTLLLAVLTSLLVACGTAAGTPAPQAPRPSEPASPSAAPSEAPAESPAGEREVAGTITVAEGMVASGPGFTIEEALEAGPSGELPTLVHGVLFRDADGSIYLATSVGDVSAPTFEGPMLEVLNMANDGESWDMANAELLGLEEANGIVFNQNVDILGFLEISSAPEDASAPIPADALVAARVEGLRIRATPGLDGEALGTITSGSQSLVVDGPELADGLEWYLISGLGIPNGSGCVTGPDPTNPFTCPVWLGWAARAAADGTPWLEEVEPECADPAGSLDAFVSQPRYLYIACYGDEPLTLRGYLLAQPGVPLEDPCPAIPEEQRWLGCVLPTFQLVSAANTGLGLVMTLGPGGGLPGDGGEIVVEGHFDDPAATECTFGDEPGRSVLECRSQFVVDSPGGAVGP
jgi:hypothetical protein